MEDSGVEDGIMEATHRALCEHGYASLTMRDIAEESEKSKATLHYHYNTKQELLLVFLDYLFEKFHDRLEGIETEDPTVGVVEILTPKSDEVSEDFRTAVLEMKAQSPYNEGFRSRLVEHETVLKGHLEETVRRGVEEGVFREEVEPSKAAEFLITLVNGLRARSVTVGKTDEELRETVEEYVEKNLISEGSREVRDEEGEDGSAGGDA